MSTERIRYRIWQDDDGYHYQTQFRVTPSANWKQWRVRACPTQKNRDRHLRKSIKNIRIHLQNLEAQSAAPWELMQG